jgi:hypothetical protein
MLFFVLKPLRFALNGKLTFWEETSCTLSAKDIAEYCDKYIC